MFQPHATPLEANARKGGLRTQTARPPRAIPWSSVRGLITSGFGLLVFILAVVTVAAAWQVSRHQGDLEELEFHSNRAALILNVETQGSTAGLLLQRYVDAGGDTYPAEINAHVTAAALSLQEILNKPDPPAEFERVASVGLTLMLNVARAAELRRIGNVDAARLVLEDMVPAFRDYRLTLEAMTADEFAQVAELRESADQTGRLAFWLIVASGTLGVIFGLVVSVLIARAIIRPLGSLEGTAAAVSKGDLGARAFVTSPRELASLGRTLNDMMTTLQARNQELEERNRQLTDARTLASTDGLTGIFNHRTFQEHIRALADEAGARTPVSLIMLDIDFFKQINDSLGHQKGDEILRSVTETCAAIAGEGAVYRYGGDEIAVVLAGKPLLEAERVGEMLRAAIAKNSGQIASPVTISVGVASYPATASSSEELIYRADAAMYAAKSSGKNRVRRWDEIGQKQPEGAAGAVGPNGPATSRAE